MCRNILWYATRRFCLPVQLRTTKVPSLCALELSVRCVRYTSMMESRLLERSTSALSKNNIYINITNLNSTSTSIIYKYVHQASTSVHIYIYMIYNISGYAHNSLVPVPSKGKKIVHPPKILHRLSAYGRIHALLARRARTRRCCFARASMYTIPGHFFLKHTA